MLCPFCGGDNPEGAKFCGVCGKDMFSAKILAEREKPSSITDESKIVFCLCGEENPEEAIFCTGCGKELGVTESLAIYEPPSDMPSNISNIFNCPLCGGENPKEATFCGVCGKSISNEQSGGAQFTYDTSYNTPVPLNNQAPGAEFPSSRKLNHNRTMIISLSVILFVLIGGAVAYYAFNFVGLNKQIDLGNKYLVEGKYKQAIATFDKVVADNPDSMTALAGLAQALIGNGDYDKAKEIIFAVQEPDQLILEQYRALINAFIEQGDYEEAQQILGIAQDKFQEDKTLKILADYLQIKQENADAAGVTAESNPEMDNSSSSEPTSDPVSIPEPKPPVQQSYPKDSVSGIY